MRELNFVKFPVTIAGMIINFDNNFTTGDLSIYPASGQVKIARVGYIPTDFSYEYTGFGH